MNARRVIPLLSCALACGGSQGEPEIIGFEPPVATGPASAIEYPLDLFEEGIEGTVVLHLFVDERGAVIADSTRVAEPSGHAALDSAALDGVATMEFAPARRDGQAVASAFLQPVLFRKPETVTPAQ